MRLLSDQARAKPVREAVPWPLVTMPARKVKGTATVLLRAGTYYLAETIELGASDSGLTIASYQDERVIVSGGVPAAVSAHASSYAMSAPIETPKSAKRPPRRWMCGCSFRSSTARMT